MRNHIFNFIFPFWTKKKKKIKTFMNLGLSQYIHGTIFWWTCCKLQATTMYLSSNQIIALLFWIIICLWRVNHISYIVTFCVHFTLVVAYLWLGTIFDCLLVILCYCRIAFHYCLCLLRYCRQSRRNAWLMTWLGQNYENFWIFRQGCLWSWQDMIWWVSIHIFRDLKVIFCWRPMQS